MKPVERFFRKYFLSMVGIIALFLLLNVVLFFSVLIWAWQTSETPDLSMSEICDRITLDGTGHLTAAGELAEMLEEHHAWAMVLDDIGTVIFPVSYTHLRAHETKANLVCRLLLEKNFFNDTATTEIYTYAIVGSVRCV